MGRQTTCDFFKNFGGELEREVVQEHDDFLTGRDHILAAAHDQRRRQQVHFLKWHVTVHPMRPRRGCIIITAGFTRLQQRHRFVLHTILPVWRQLTMPVNNRVLCQCVCQIDAKSLARVQKDTLLASPVGQAKHRGCPPVDIQYARARC